MEGAVERLSAVGEKLVPITQAQEPKKKNRSYRKHVDSEAKQKGLKRKTVVCKHPVEKVEREEMDVKELQRLHRKKLRLFANT